MASTEAVIRRYLEALKDSSTLRDDEAIGAVQQELATTEDVIARLRLHQEAAQLAAPSIEDVEAEFIGSVKDWAEEQGIGVEAFRSEGVTDSVLRRAGFATANRRGMGRRKGGASRHTKTARVTTEEVIAAMPTGAFTVKGLGEASGASPAVVRKAVAAEVEAGRVAETGPDPDHARPGRAPMLYERKA